MIASLRSLCSIPLPRWGRSDGARAPRPLSVLTVAAGITTGLAGAPAAVAADEVAEEPRLTLHAAAVRRAGSVRVDGHLDEAAWQAAPSTGGFRQRAPREGATPAQSTEFRVLFDDTALYVGVFCHDEDPRAIRSLLTRRDQESASDWIMIGIDSYHDRRTSFVFGVNPAGVQRDLIIFDDAMMDNSWDAVWSAATSIDTGGWVAELRIPYSQLRFSSDPDQIWGLQLQRVVGRSREESVWSPWPKSGNQIVSRYGTLDGIRGIQPPGRLEVLPFVVGGAGIEEEDPGGPFGGQLEGKVDIGLDAKYGLGSSFTLAATVNPDFGQVEADPSQVNLTDKETFFPDKRPFFVEGADMFRFPLSQGDDPSATETLFYTRRIGGAPHDSADDDGDYLDEPSETTIYGAAKLSGKTPSGWAVGVLDAVTAEEQARFAGADGVVHERAIEPLTNFAVAKVTRDFNDGRTNVGAAATAVHRQLHDTGLGDLLHDQAYTGGIKLNHRLPGDQWAVEAALSGSWVHGSREAIDETQRSSARYFQRPDNGYAGYDPNRTSLAGGALQWAFGKWSGGHWRFGTGGDTRSPGFEANDIGYQRESDYHVQWGWLQYREDAPSDYLLDYALNTNTWLVTNFEPDVRNVGGNVNAHVTFPNYWGLGVGGGVDMNMLDDAALRGGPQVRNDPQIQLWSNANTDARRQVSATLNGSGWWQPATASGAVQGTLTLNVQALSNLDLGVGPTVDLRWDDRQYVDEVVDTDGMTHYILARIDQVVTGLTARLNYTYSPTLSLQAYAQPFIATGAYGEYKDLADPRARRYADRFDELAPSSLRTDTDNGVIDVDRNGDGTVDYSFDLPDFDFREIRSTVVGRWEYRPGSAVFLIWSHQRSSDSIDGRYRLGHELRELADTPGEHVVLLKLNYWIGL